MPVFALALLAGACAGSPAARGKIGVTVEPIPSATPAAATTVTIGGNPATPIATPQSDLQPSGALRADPATATPGPDAPPTASPAPEADAPPAGASPAPAPLALDGSSPPTSGRWIDVDVTQLVVKLMDGTAVLRQIGPVAVGAAIDTGEYASTQTGLFHVYNKIEALQYDPPYNTYISHWVGFDPDKANGFHSLLQDKDGNVVNAATGRISNGCIRTAEPDAIYAFAEVGMPVWVHH